VSGSPGVLLSTEAAGAGTTADGKPYAVDGVSISGPAVGTYNSKDVSTATTVTYSGLSLSGAGNTNYTLTIQGSAAATVTPKTLTESGLSVAASKVYDGTTAVTLIGSASLQSTEAGSLGTGGDGKPYTGDVVSLTGTAIGTYNSKNVTTATTVTYSGLSLTGAQSGNYTLTIQGTSAATITAKTLTMSGLSVPLSKVYDGTTVAVVSGSPGLLQTAETGALGTGADGRPYTSDVVSTTGSATGTYNAKDVSTASTVTYAAISLTGAQASNYTLAIQGNSLATITPKNLTIIGVTANNKIFDNTTTASLSGVATFQAAEAGALGTAGDGKPYTGDVVTISGSPTSNFSSVGPGAGITVNVVGYTLSGLQASNYSPVQPTGLSATIYGITTTVTSGAAPTSTISSLWTVEQGVSVLNFNFVVTDVGDDGSPTSFTGLVINAGLNDQISTIANWSAAIQGVRLLDNSGNSQTSNISVGANTITITSINPATLGNVNNGNAKAYSLKIWLNTALGAVLQSSIDNRQFEFNVKTTSFNGVNATGSQIVASQNISSGAGVNVVTVVSTALAFTTQPVPLSQLILASFTTPPVAKAVDNYGNVDRDINGVANNVSITNAAGDKMENPPPSTAVTPFMITPALGVINFPANFQYADQFNLALGGTFDGTLTATVGSINSNSGNGAIPCSPVAVSYSNATTLTGGTGAATISSIAPSAVTVFTFAVNDDGGVAGGDGADTKISSFKFTPNGSNQFGNFQDLIASATLTDGTNTMTVTSATGLNTMDITFGGLSFTTGSLGNVPDSQTKTYTLSITLNTTLTNGLAASADNSKLILDILQSNITLDQTGSTIPVGQSQNSGTGNGSFQVFTTQLKFTTQPVSSPGYYLVSTVLSGQPPVPIVEALDANGNRDLDYSATITASCAVGATPIALGTAPTAFVNGIITNAVFGNMSVNAIATGAKLTIHSTVANLAPGPVVPSDALSTAFNVKVGLASTISSPTALGGVPSTATTATAGGNSTGAASVFSFTVNDDGNITPNDGNPTLVSQITFRQNINTTINSPGLADWTQAIAGAILSDGTHTSVLDFSIPANTGYLTATSITFPSLLTTPTALSTDIGYIADSPNPSVSLSSKTYTLSIWLKSNLNATLQATIDGLKFGFDIQSDADVVTDPNGTALISPQTALTPAGNTVAVVATQLVFTNPSTPSTVDLLVNLPGGVIQAWDVNSNLDLNFNGIITSFSNASIDATLNGPTIGTSHFSAGIYNVPNNFQFASGSNLDNVTITIKADNVGGNSGTTCGTNAICAAPAPLSPAGFSPALTLRTSFESWLTRDPTFTIPATIPYVAHQEAVLTNSSYELLRVLLVDGSRTSPATYNGQPLNVNNTDSGDGDPNGDLDGAPTNLTSITIQISNPWDLRTIALFDGNGNQIGSQINVSAAYNSGPANFTFTGGPILLTAPDDSYASFSLRASFQNTFPKIQDGDNIEIQLIAASVATSSSSQFFNGNPANSATPGTYIGGGLASNQNPNSLGLIDVVATSLDFTTQPSGYAGINEPIGKDPSTTQPYSYGNPATLTLMPTTTPGKVTARDKFALVDTGFAPTSILIRDASNNGLGLPVNFNFVSGVMDLNGMSYPLVGNGSVKIIATVSSGPIDSSAPGINTSGTITTSTSTPIVTGVGTQFTTDLAVGSIINSSGSVLIGTVASITDDTHFTLNANALTAVVGASYNANSIPCALVNVLDVSVTQNFSNVVPGTGNPPIASLKGGLQGQDIFGLKFTANSAAGSEPELKGFTIGFKGTNGQNLAFQNNSSTIFKNFNVFINGTANNITSVGGTLALSSSTNTPGVFDQIIVDLSAQPQSLSSGSMSFFLVTDVDASTNSGTPTIIPYFKDSGWGNADDQNSIVSNGTSSGAFDGNQYSFASTKPPVLEADAKLYPGTLTSPYAGQPNVDPSLSQIVLQFDTNVGSLDGGGVGSAELWSRSSNTKVADLVLNTTTPVLPLPLTPQAQGVVTPQNTVLNIYPSLLFDIKNGPPQLTADEVYFVKLVQGSYDPTTKIGHGISDYGLNFYGGISDNSTLYFKISSQNNINLLAAQSSFNTTTLGTLTTQFDQLGTAYFIAVKAGDPAPTVSEITGASNYVANHPTATVGAFSSYSISAVSVNQTYTFSATFTAGQNYDVYIFAQNDAVPTPVKALGIYGASPGYTAQTSGPILPTLTIAGTSIAVSQSSTTPNNVPPNSLLLYTLCPDSYTTITNPMVIGEAVTSFSSNVDQDFNLLLPTGFQFDVTVSPDVQLIGGNFQNLNSLLYSNSGSHPMWEYKYVSTTVVNIRFFNKNNPGNVQDFIAVSGLSIIGKSGSSQGSIQWFYGNNVFTTAGTPTFGLAQIALVSSTAPDFTNTFWAQNQPFPVPLNNGFAIAALNKTVNAIPDNYVDVNNPGAVRLLPIASTFASGDYLASFFSGTGVSGDLLTLNAVPTGAAFNITINHTDLNGCATSRNEQYVVYDHNSPISKKLGVTGNSTTPTSPDGTKQDIVNTNFNTAINGGKANPVISPVLAPGELAGYSLLRLSVDLPASSLTASSTPISGPTWRNLVHSNIIDSLSGPAPTYSWDYSKILNASNPLLPGLTSVYDYFKSNGNTIPLSPNGNNYWVGGSLGKILFTGDYQSTADNSVYVPFRQEVELFVPSVPLIEVSSPSPYFDKGDAATTANFNPVQYPVSDKTGGYPGTATFCEFGGAVSLVAYPQPAAGTSLGSFQIYDYNSYSSKGQSSPTGSGTIVSLTSSSLVSGINTQFTTQLGVGAFLFDGLGNQLGIVQSIQDNTHLTLTALASTALNGVAYKYLSPILPSAQNSAFIDNGNGTMSLDPTNSNVRNGYNDILVTYTYQDNSSPAVGTGYLVIRVTPNPVAQFTMSSVTGAAKGASAFEAFCSSNPINFDATPSTIAQPTQGGSNNIINKYTWNFGDQNSTQNTLAGTAALGFDRPQHIFNQSQQATITLQLLSNWQCTSSTAATAVPPTIQPTNALVLGWSGVITVGEVPVVDFGFLRNCVGDQILFTDKSSTSGGTNAGAVAKFDWQFGDGVPGTPDFTGYNTILTPTAPFNFPISPDGRNLPVSGALGTNVSHVYALPKSYTVTLTTTTNLGCFASASKGISQLPVAPLDPSGAFQEFFDSSNGGWIALDLSGSTPTAPGNTSWTYNSGSGKWTAGSPYLAGGEKSALYSACLNLTAIPRPVVSFNNRIDLNPSDGLVLQYSTDSLNIQDPNKTWNVLGTPTTTSGGITPSPGLDWYNVAALASAPGTGYVSANNSGAYGWSHFIATGKKDGIDSAGFIAPKHSLDNLITKKHVVLRFALTTLPIQSSTTTTPTGITLDSVRVGSRTRTVLLENFTTTDATSAVLNNAVLQNSDSITAFVNRKSGSTQIVNINYHIGFMGRDPFNFDNPADPSARALYYNVNQVPYAFLDGKNSANSPIFSTWGTSAYDLETLRLAQADFLDAPNPLTTVTTNNPDGSIQINVNVTPRVDLPVGIGGTALFAAVLERQVALADLKSPSEVKTGETQFSYVLRKMLPNAAGTVIPITTPLAAKTPVSLGTLTWIPDTLYTNMLTVVVFLQNVTTKEVYQAEIFDNLTAPPTVTEVSQMNADNVKVYPNPADKEFTIVLPNPATQTTSVQIADQLGRIIDVGAFNEGEQTKTVNTQGLSAGMYILMLGNNGSAVRTKIIVVHK